MENCLFTQLENSVSAVGLSTLNAVTIHYKSSVSTNVATVYLSGNSPYKVFGNGQRCTSSGEPYSNPSAQLAMTNYFNGIGDFDVVISNTLLTKLNMTYPTATTSYIRLEDCYYFNDLAELSLNEMNIKGDLMNIGKVNKTLSKLEFFGHSKYEISNNKLEDFLVNWEHENGTCEILIQVNTSNYVGEKFSFHDATAPTERLLITFASDSITVAKKTGSVTLGTYNKSNHAWTYA